MSSRNTRIFDANNNEIPCQIDVVFKDLDQNELAPTANLFSVSFIVQVPPVGAMTYFVAIGHGSAPPAR